VGSATSSTNKTLMNLTQVHSRDVKLVDLKIVAASIGASAEDTTSGNIGGTKQ